MDRVISSADIGKKIKLYRQKAGLTQENLAEILEVTFQQVQNYENGKTRLNTDKLQKLCNALNISESHLLSDVSEQQYQLSPSESILIDTFRSIKSEEKKECVIILVEALRKQKK